MNLAENTKIMNTLAEIHPFLALIAPLFDLFTPFFDLVASLKTYLAVFDLLSRF
jgi:hypothetical protein